jgi:hypothetical protein
LRAGAKSFIKRSTLGWRRLRLLMRFHMVL